MIEYSNNQDVNLKGCTNNGNVIGSGFNIGGIVGGTESSLSIENCTNTGNIISKHEDSEEEIYIGGIIGGCGIRASIEIKSCINKGNVSAKGTFVGGISGYVGSFINCVNQGNIEGASYIGGIAPLIFGEIKNVSNTGKVYAKGSEDVQAIVLITILKCIEMKKNYQYKKTLTKKIVKVS